MPQCADVFFVETQCLASHREGEISIYTSARKCFGFTLLFYNLPVPTLRLNYILS